MIRQGPDPVHRVGIPVYQVDLKTCLSMETPLSCEKETEVKKSIQFLKKEISSICHF